MQRGVSAYDALAALAPHYAGSAAVRPLTLAERFAWGLTAVSAFHLAYELWPPLILVFLASMCQLARAATRQEAMYSGWLLGVAIYGPQLGFFWTIFGPAAIALWLVLATWLAVYLVLQRFTFLKLGSTLGAFAAPFLWTGLEYFRSELYYLRFSWLTIGYAFSSSPRGVLPWLGTYGIGFVLMLLAAHFPFRPEARISHRAVWSAAVLALFALGPGLDSLKARAHRVSGNVQMAGVQLEFPDEQTVLAQLNRLESACPNAPLFVLPEYTFDGPVPSTVKDWCAKHRKYLVAGGKEYLEGSPKTYRNTAFVIGPDGGDVFSQAKKVPIQFFDDGKSALGQKIWDSPWGRIGLCVCYDLSYTRVTDELIRQGAQAIIVPTMDVEHWGEREHRLHARIAPMRAAEYGVPIFRLCSSGVSQAVDAGGRVHASAPFPGQKHFISAAMALGSAGRLPLDRVLVWPCVAVCLVALLSHLQFSFLNRKSSPELKRSP